MRILILAVLALLFIPALASASIDIEIQMKDSFEIGEVMTFNYSIISDVNTKIAYVPYIICTDIPSAPVTEQTSELKANQIYKNEYSSSKIGDFVNTQACTAYIQILSPAQQTFTKNFLITANPSFSIELRTCKDPACINRSKVFIQEDSVYLDYSSSVANPSISATLAYPDGTSGQVSLPGSIKATQTGTYTLDVTASKQGYNSQSVKEQFGAIQGEADIQSASMCNSNGRCDSGENGQNCPQDCEKSVNPAGSVNVPPYLFPALFIFILILILIMVFLIKRNS
jgi:hypothetical protein